MTTQRAPYRTQAHLPICSTINCVAPAQLACPRCGRPFCAQHTAMSSNCPDCELAVSRRAGRLISWLVGSVALCCLPLSIWIGMQAPHWLPALLLAALATGGSLAAGVSRLVRGPSPSWVPLSGAEWHIAADGGTPRQGRRLQAGRARTRDMYTAAYEAGFNRVQGCA